MRYLRPNLLAGLILSAGCPNNGNESTTSMTGSSSEASTGGSTSTSGSTSDEPTTGGSISGSTSGSSTAGSTTGSPGGACGVYLESKHAALMTLCTCFVETMQFPDLETCLMFLNDPPEEEQCTCDVLADFPGLDPFLACQTAVQDELSKCVGAANCSDMAALESCFNAASDATDMCPESDKQADGTVDLQCYDAPAFMCKSGEQIPQWYTCDMEMDCPDSSDEEKALCIFTCMDGQEVPSYSKCDGTPDCEDQSDEPPECYFMCMNGEQILKEYVCDGFDDCMDGSDEVGDCTFMCTSGEEIPKNWKCDGEPDCRDGSDETNCP